MTRMLERFIICDQLASITRYSRDHMLKRESVLEHIGFATLYSLLLCRELQRDGHVIDVGLVLTKATVHDIDESIFGDVPRVTKYFSPEIAAAFKKIEAEGVEGLFKNLGLPDMKQDWADAKNDTLEGEVVALVDLAAVVYKVWNEIAVLGNMGFLRVFREVQTFVVERMHKIALKPRPIQKGLLPPKAEPPHPLLKHYVEMNHLLQFMKKYDTQDVRVDPQGVS